jgi:hypothetical protein
MRPAPRRQALFRGILITRGQGERLTNHHASRRPRTGTLCRFRLQAARFVSCSHNGALLTPVALESCPAPWSPAPHLAFPTPPREDHGTAELLSCDHAISHSIKGMGFVNAGVRDFFLLYQHSWVWNEHGYVQYVCLWTGHSYLPVLTGARCGWASTVKF